MEHMEHIDTMLIDIMFIDIIFIDITDRYININNKIFYNIIYQEPLNLVLGIVLT